MVVVIYTLQSFDVPVKRLAAHIFALCAEVHPTVYPMETTFMLTERALLFLTNDDRNHCIDNRLCHVNITDPIPCYNFHNSNRFR
jgi:hypothetical protein